ncbi:hypothetical protein K431DRAFT_286324 [Polychaeton citri CBS 116435]|uniref:Uncharacterized protein n=1 Tax=Polychaeton citri CBS 116435 TaxID=1314669 RepID=A0A9P4Q3D3_9PEZI|nr:hypothetical protein K431DRAFT_286324 [Polychaeton citri CBS 116435]
MGNILADEDDVHVLDLPQLYTKPPATTILEALDLLKIEPQTWQQNPPKAALSRHRLERNEEVPAYLTRIISSSLLWIENGEAKEQIWEVASKRLSERSGRTGMGSFDRHFNIPLRTDALQGAKQKSQPSEANGMTGGLHDKGTVVLELHEPTLTGDNLGLKTWASSHLLARRLCSLRENENFPKFDQEEIVLELGSGTGLVGLAAAAVFRTQTFLTDLPEIVPNLRKNAEANAQVIKDRGGSVDCGVLDWTNPSAFTPPNQRSRSSPNNFPLILAADPIYSPEHPSLLANAVAYHLAHVDDARLVIELPIREAYGPERQNLRERLSVIGLRLSDEGEETGVDDWIGQDGELAEIKCWWSVWSWRKHW